MAPRRPKAEEPAVETDRIAGQRHPRETFRLVGQDAALGRASRAIRSGRPPQAWLIGGPPGIGKATLAYRIARYLLRMARPPKARKISSVAENDPVSAQVKSGAHPGLLVLKRGANPETGKLMTILSVDEIRKLGNFFGLTSGAGGWRVAIVDTADDMNDNAANALLKLLEEPPPRAMLLLLAHAPARLLPTIRSRCQRLELRPLDDAALEAELRKALARNDRGRTREPRQARRRLDRRGAEARRRRRPDARHRSRQADRSRVDAGFLRHAGARRQDRAHRRRDGDVRPFPARRLGRTHPRPRPGRRAILDRWVALWERLEKSFGRTEALHLEPRQTILSAAQALAQTGRRGSL